MLRGLDEFSLAFLMEEYRMIAHPFSDHSETTFAQYGLALAVAKRIAGVWSTDKLRYCAQTGTKSIRCCKDAATSEAQRLIALLKRGWRWMRLRVLPVRLDGGLRFGPLAYTLTEEIRRGIPGNYRTDPQQSILE